MLLTDWPGGTRDTAGAGRAATISRRTISESNEGLVTEFDDGDVTPEPVLYIPLGFP